MSKWYVKSRDSVKSHYPEDWRLMIGFLAVTSPNASVTTNVSLAIKAMEQHKAGKPFTGYMGPVIANLNRVKAGQPASGRKIQAFQEALLGNQYAVVIDRWMMRAYGYDKLNVGAYRAIQAAIYREAEEEGMYPAEYQAQLWIQFRGAGEDFADILNAKRAGENG